MPELFIAIVGTKFKKLAKQVLTCLPRGFELKLAPEPDNVYDSNAIGVWVDVGIFLTDHPDLESDLESALIGTGYDVEEFCSESPVQLGYLPDSDGAVIRKHGGAGNREAAAFIENTAYSCQLDFSSEGLPMVKLSKS